MNKEQATSSSKEMDVCIETMRISPLTALIHWLPPQNDARNSTIARLPRAKTREQRVQDTIPS